MFRTIRRQRRLGHGEHRESLPSCVIKEIRDCVEQDANRFGVSKSFVIAVILANAYGINKQEDFLDTAISKDKVKKELKRKDK